MGFALHMVSHAPAGLKDLGPGHRILKEHERLGNWMEILYVNSNFFKFNKYDAGSIPGILVAYKEAVFKQDTLKTV